VRQGPRVDGCRRLETRQARACTEVAIAGKMHRREIAKQPSARPCESVWYERRVVYVLRR